MRKSNYEKSKIEEKISIKKAEKIDLEKIAQIKVSGWNTAFKNIVSDDYLNKLNVQEQVQKYLKYDLNSIFVVTFNGEIIAFARIYDYSEPVYDDKEIDCEIREIFVDPSLKRMGIGSKLFNYIVEYFKIKNKKKLYLGCFSDNFNSRKFYEKMGGQLTECSELVLDKSYNMVSYIFKINV